MSSMLTREQAWEIVCEFTKSDGLRKHALAVETCVAAYARKLGEDEAQVVASRRCCTTSIGRFTPRSKSIRRRARRFSPNAAWTRRSAARFFRTPITPACRAITPLEKTLYACDELAGFITAISYVKPHRSVFEVDVASVKKKMKDKAFARSVNRQDIIEGAQELGVPLEEHIEFCIKAMQARADELGLKGTLDAGA